MTTTKQTYFQADQLRGRAIITEDVQECTDVWSALHYGLDRDRVSPRASSDAAYVSEVANEIADHWLRNVRQDSDLRRELRRVIKEAQGSYAPVHSAVASRLMESMGDIDDTEDKMLLIHWHAINEQLYKVNTASAIDELEDLL